MNKILLELFETGGKYDYEFTYKTGEGENVASLDLENKKIYIFVGNPNDEDLDIILGDVLKQLKQGL